jgi:hypothetical protein
MPTFTLTRTGQAPIRFEGELVAEASSRSHEGGPLQNRWHEIEIFLTECGRVLAHVEFCSRHQGEFHHHTVVDVLSPRPLSLSSWLQSYDYRTGWQGYPSGEHYAERQARIEQAIGDGYRRAVSEVLAEFPEELAPTEDSADASDRYVAADPDGGETTLANRLAAARAKVNVAAPKPVEG